MDIDQGQAGVEPGTIRNPAQNDAGPQRIKALDSHVVNKIAAGEIIVAPVHALKELVENSVDAGATSIDVTVKDGGLKLLQIVDNGCGIEKDDLGILCERHTTSKISEFEDLESVSTYGFRGEALASISHIAHLSVVTKTRKSDLAWRARYEDGKLVPAVPGQPAQPTPQAGRIGTQITVEDLFYNVPTRRRAFRSASDELNKIVDMIGRYAVHRTGVAFMCRKQGDASPNLVVQSGASNVDRIRQVYGSSVASELVELETADSRWAFEARGWATNANFHVKKTTLLLFINHRAVESAALKKAIEQVYSVFLPKNGRPFVYISLEIEPHRVDVNVHPTKREVHFLNEDEIIQSVCEHIRSALSSVDSSRTFMTQTLLPTSGWDGTASQSEQAQASAAQPDGREAKRQRRNSSTLVRTDANTRKITSMFLPQGNPGDVASGEEPQLDIQQSSPENINYTTEDRQVVHCRLNSVKQLRGEVRVAMHHDLTETISNHTFVGIVDDQRRLAAVQSGTKLYLVDYGHACFEYFYQVGLTDFSNFGTIQFRPPLAIETLLSKALEYVDESSIPAIGEPGTVKMVAALMVERREMLGEYFSLEVTPDGELASLPILVQGYSPPLVKLPQFLLRLGLNVDWTEEKACFETFLKELASFYVPEQLPPVPGNEEGLRNENIPDEVRTRRRHVRWALEHVLFPAMKSRLVATHALMEGAVTEIANLKGLYRVFERC